MKTWKKNKAQMSNRCSTPNGFDLQRLIDYRKYLEATAKSKTKQTDVDKLAAEVSAAWWIKNRKRLIR